MGEAVENVHMYQTRHQTREIQAILEITNLETINLETTNLEIINLETTDLEITDLETTDLESQTNLETTNLDDHKDQLVTDREDLVIQASQMDREHRIPVRRVARLQ